jgi:hypothetical protein
MNKVEYDKLVEKFRTKSYRKWNNTFNHADYYWGKSFHKDDNPFDDEGRSGYQLIIYVYDYSDKDYPQLPPEQRDHVGLEATIMVSRTIDERIDMTLSWNDKSTIESIEEAAESFYQWACTYWPTPREF